MTQLYVRLILNLTVRYQPGSVLFNIHNVDLLGNRKQTINKRVYLSNRYLLIDLFMMNDAHIV
jgi:hypothetical protein